MDGYRVTPSYKTFQFLSKEANPKDTRVLTPGLPRLILPN
jgi:hypothetical protein